MSVASTCAVMCIGLWCKAVRADVIKSAAMLPALAVDEQEELAWTGLKLMLFNEIVHSYFIQVQLRVMGNPLGGGTLMKPLTILKGRPLQG